MEHGKNSVFEDELKMGNIVLTECVLEKFAEAKGARAKKVGFKLLTVGFIDKGVPLSTKVWNITAAPSKRILCLSASLNYCGLCFSLFWLSG